MRGSTKFYALPAVLLGLTALGFAQERDRRNRANVESYVIDAEINPKTQAITAKARMQVIPLDDRVSSLTFELNNALAVTRVTGADGKTIPATRNSQDFTVRLNFLEPLDKDKPVTFDIEYEGKLTGKEESPIYGIRFASIQEDYSYLLYPSRWFPVNDYMADRFAAELNITVPAGYRVFGSGLDSKEETDGKVKYSWKFAQQSFPGSIGVIKGEPARVASTGAASFFYFHTPSSKGLVQAYGEELGKVMAFAANLFGLPPTASLQVMETEDGAPAGFSAPGVLFLNPKGIGRQVNSRLLTNQVARQWWGNMVPAANRNHLWITNGLARFTELLFVEQAQGPGAMESETRDLYVEALTVENPPLIQSARFEDYSPEYWAATGGKGAAVFNMLRDVAGPENFIKMCKALADQYAWKGVTTDDVRKVMEQVGAQNMQGFFIQWIESNGAPEFKLEYRVYRTQKGFRVMGKIEQDLDTFRMPVTIRVETEGNPEERRVDVVGTSSEFLVETFGKPKRIIVDPSNRMLRYSNPMRVLVAIRRGEQLAEVSEYSEALKEYQKALDVSRNSSLAHFRVAEVFFLQNNYQAAANSFREALNGDLEPRWTEVWAHINLGNIFDVTSQRERAVNEYNLALRTKDNTQGALEEAAKYVKEPYQRKARSN
ncbi:MAG: peptidase M1 [Candidatus Solibacter usitatus]|nr:peptidase M1 [Candidatus Solibacter usitatus]